MTDFDDLKLIGPVRLYPVCPECGHPQDQVRDVEDERDSLKEQNERMRKFLSEAGELLRSWTSSEKSYSIREVPLVVKTKIYLHKWIESDYP